MNEHEHTSQREHGRQRDHDRLYAQVKLQGQTLGRDRASAIIGPGGCTRGPEPDEQPTSHRTSTHTRTSPRTRSITISPRRSFNPAPNKHAAVTSTRLGGRGARTLECIYHNVAPKSAAMPQSSATSGTHLGGPAIYRKCRRTKLSNWFRFAGQIWFRRVGYLEIQTVLRETSLTPQPTPPPPKNRQNGRASRFQGIPCRPRRLGYCHRYLQREPRHDPHRFAWYVRKTAAWKVAGRIFRAVKERPADISQTRPSSSGSLPATSLLSVSPRRSSTATTTSSLTSSSRRTASSPSRPRGTRPSVSGT